MNLGTQQLNEIHTVLMTQFAGDPVISIRTVAGNPPEQYEISYDVLSASKNVDASITITRGHSISLTIPFGFPHFPPSCKPLGNTFHPDFDDAAICLGDFWQNHRDLVLLIHHLGSMLCGEIYSLENAFNEEAAQWFGAHRSSLPFQEYTSQVKQPTSIESFSAGTATEESLPIKLAVGILEDDDFDDDLNRPHPPTEDDAKVSPPQQDGQATRELTSELWELARKKCFNQLHDRLGSLTRDDVRIDGQELLLQQVQNALDEAQKLFNEAKRLEQEGDAENALRLYRSVHDTVADHPQVYAALQRTEQTRALFNEIKASERQSHADEGSDEAQGSDAAPPIPDAEERSTLARKFLALAKYGSVFSSFSVMPTIVVTSVLLLVGTVGFFLYSFSNQLKRSQALLSDCQAQISQHNFTAAEKSCLGSIEITQGLLFIPKSRVNAVKQSAEKLLQSEEMRQGLLGLVQFNGKYIPKTLIIQQKQLTELLDQADKQFANSEWSEASSNYAKALEMHQENKQLEVANSSAVEASYALARFNLFLQQAEQKSAEGKENEAVSLLSQAQKLVPRVAQPQTEESQQKIDAFLSKYKFNELRQQANHLFEKSDWQGAYQLYHKAVELGKNLSFIKHQELVELQNFSAKANLYALIEEGNSAFASQRWDTAVDQLTKARNLLRTNESGLSGADLEKNQRKLDRIILQAHLIRNRQLAENALNAKDKTKALTLLNETLRLAKGSTLENDLEIQALAVDIEQKLKTLKDDAFIEDKSKYLLDNYKTLFLEHYLAAKTENLSNPVVAFEKKSGQLFVFQMKCTETNAGRRLTLVMFYAYDPTTNRWKFFGDS